MAIQNSPIVVKVKAGDYWWCACGQSLKHPYCDGSHARNKTGLQPIKVNIPQEKTVAWCGCKQSASKPFCDGTHSTLG